MSEVNKDTKIDRAIIEQQIVDLILEQQYHVRRAQDIHEMILRLRARHDLGEFRLGLVRAAKAPEKKSGDPVATHPA